MTLEKLRQGKNLLACIEAGQLNLASFNQLKASGEIKIEAMHDDASKPIYLSGKDKNMVMDLLIDKEQKWIDEKNKEFESL